MPVAMLLADLKPVSVLSPIVTCTQTLQLRLAKKKCALESCKYSISAAHCCYGESDATKATVEVSLFVLAARDKFEWCAVFKNI